MPDNETPSKPEPQQRARTRPRGRNLADFSDLSAAEDKLRKAVAQGEIFYAGFSRPDKDGATNDNRLRADFVRFLALGGDAQTPVHEKGVQLYGGYITGELDLQGGKVRCPLALRDCWFDTKPYLREARLRRLSLSGSRLPGLDAVGAKFTGDLYMSNVLAEGRVWLQGAEIVGTLDCHGGSFNNRTENGQGEALNCVSAKIKDDVFLNQGFTAEGQLSLLGAEIGGQLSCSGGSFKNRTKDGQGQALNCQSAKIKESVFLNQDFTAEGQVQGFTAEGTGFAAGRGDRRPRLPVTAAVLKTARRMARARPSTARVPKSRTPCF